MQNPYTKASRIYAMLFFHLAAEYCRTFGEAGEAALRDAVKKYGIDRGKAARDDHEQRGYPINLKTLFSTGDFPGVAESFQRNIIDWQPHQRISETTECPLYDQWKSMGGLKEGQIYCEVIHKNMWSAYHKGIATKQPKIMPRGDDVCRFEVRMPEAEKFHEISLEEGLGHLMDIQAKMYYYLGKGLCAFGLEGEAALRRAIRLYGRERGLNLRREHLARGLEINLKNLFNHYDLYSHIDPRIRKNQREFTEQSRINESLNCTLFDTWKQYPDGIDIGRIYCEEVHHQIYGAYDDAVQINLTHTLTRGDDRCRFSTYLRPANRISPPTWHEEYNKKISAANSAAD